MLKKEISFFLKQNSHCTISAGQMNGRLRLMSLHTRHGIQIMSFVRLTNLKKFTGEVGHRSQYLSHAKRALYHMSYIPMKDYQSLFPVASLTQRHFERNKKNAFVFLQHLPREEKSGEVGHRSQYLSHAKRALYHMSYIPVLLFSLQGDFTRTGRRDIKGVLADGKISANRYYRRFKKDTLRQQCYDAMQQQTSTVTDDKKDFIATKMAAAVKAGAEAENSNEVVRSFFLSLSVSINPTGI